ncbi:MAG TPA: hypothetical protein VGM63_09740, partial [Mucilaginibacter sp.]
HFGYQLHYTRNIVNCSKADDHKGKIIHSAGYPETAAVNSLTFVQKKTETPIKIPCFYALV